MTYKHRYFNDNGQVKFTIELHANGMIYGKPDYFKGETYLKALQNSKVECYTNDAYLTADFELVSQYYEDVKTKARRELEVAGNILLSESDWAVLPDVVSRGTLDSVEQAEWIAYRKQVYLLKNSDNPYNVTFPNKPNQILTNQQEL
jgi:hypothetical protein